MKQYIISGLIGFFLGVIAMYFVAPYQIAGGDGSMIHRLNKYTGEVKWFIRGREM